MPNVEESAFRALFSGSRRSRMKARLSLPRDCRQTPRGSRSARTSLSRATLSLTLSAIAIAIERVASGSDQRGSAAGRPSMAAAS
jgi:hypothetical protein